jgi:hypothetical protein
MKKFILFVLLTCIISCDKQAPKQHPNSSTPTYKRTYGGKLSNPSASEIVLDNDLAMQQFDAHTSEILKRYFSGNSRWEIRSEKRYGADLVYAIRKEERNGVYKTSLNGFYSNFSRDSEIYQTRVIISFGKHYGFGRDTSKITYANPTAKKIKTIIEAEHSGTPGNSSYIILKGDFINIEIYEQAEQLARTFTIQTLKELQLELAMVLENAEEIETTGISPVKEFYPSQSNAPYFEIEDGMQPGIYVVKAGLATKAKGIVYVKAFNVETEERLSASRMTPRTTRTIGWSENGETIFPYESELTVYEGDWSHTYKARFEIWFRPEQGEEIKLLEKERVINGWER